MENAIKKLLDFKSNLTILYAEGDADGGNRKMLRFTLDGAYRVYVNGTSVKETIQPFSAVEYYNELGGHQLD